MEKKRFLLGVKKGVIDTKGTEYYIWNENKLCSGSGGVLDTVIKKSDNIIDLVEVGDLVEYLLTTSKYKTKVDRVVSPRVTNHDVYLDLQNAVVSDNDIIIIYKRQPNGDYKRYEVNHNV